MTEIKFVQQWEITGQAIVQEITVQQFQQSNNFINMNQNTRLKQVESHATNREFYDLFRPIIPSMDLTGKIAQVISALTEAVTVWFIM